MIYLKRTDYEAIVAHAEANLPNEACGLIAGREADGHRYIEKVYLLENEDRSPEHFTMSPQAQLAAVKDMRALGLTPLGNFHSHPATPSRPSEEDKRLALDPRASYMILSLAGETPVLRSFHIEGGTAAEEDLTVTESNGLSPEAVSK